MISRERILKAFESEGTPEIGAVASYDTIFIRDHWFTLTKQPWWHAFGGADEKQTAWIEDYIRNCGLEWLSVRPCPPRSVRPRLRYEERGEDVWRIDDESGEEKKLEPPTPGGITSGSATSEHGNADELPETEKEVDALVPLDPPFDRESFLADGRHDAVTAIRKRFDLVLYGQVATPLWMIYGALGYEGMMIFLAQDRELATYMAERELKNMIERIHMIAALGADAIWLEECLTDQINPKLFHEINVPLVRKCVEEVRKCGLKSIYYYCGSPTDRLDAILDAGADAVHFEEGKKGFSIEIADIVKKVDGRCTVFGNLDAINVLLNGTDDELRTEVKRQLEIGRSNGGRFVMSAGSPITPETPVERVKLYTDLVRELGT